MYGAGWGQGQGQGWREGGARFSVKQEQPHLSQRACWARNQAAMDCSMQRVESEAQHQLQVAQRGFPRPVGGRILRSLRKEVRSRQKKGRGEEKHVVQGKSMGSST